jgi:predicted transcriptional regulator of viral defense system
MKMADIDLALGEISAGQWGMLTATQARARGINRSNLAHREGDGRLERLAHGVYRQAGSPSLPLNDLRAAWLSTNPAKLAHERTADPDVIVGSAAGALVHRIGGIDPLPYRLITRDRRQTQRQEITYSQRPVRGEDVTVRDGLPVTTVERTIADLLRDYGDISLVADALRDATRMDRELDEGRLAHLLAPLAQRYGHPEGRGDTLLDQLLAVAERDAASRALEALQNPVLAASITQMLVNQQAAMNDALKPIMETMLKSMPTMTMPVPPILPPGIMNLPSLNLTMPSVLSAQLQATASQVIRAAGVDDAIQRILEPTRQMIAAANPSWLKVVQAEAQKDAAAAQAITEMAIPAKLEAEDESP